MVITFYNVKDENEVINKQLGSPVLIGEDQTQTTSFKIKKPTNYMNLELIFQTAPDIHEANYCKIERKIGNTVKWTRYFYITDREFLNGQLVRLSLKQDVLKSFEQQILSRSTFVERSQESGNPYLQDTIYPTSTQRRIFTNTMGSFDGTLKNYLVVTNGGEE